MGALFDSLAAESRGVLDIRAHLREFRSVLSTETLLHRDGLEITDVACRHGRGAGVGVERSDRYAVVFVRRGCFARTCDGVATLLDPTLAYCMNPGQEQRFEHPHDHGDDCTALSLSPELIASLWGGDPTLPAAPLTTSPQIDLEHRLLLRAGRGAGADRHELFERAIRLTATALKDADPLRVASGRPATSRARRAAVDGAREILTAAPERSLPQIAAELAVSPYHLSRIFRASTGHTISRHRMRLRTRSALERLAAGEDNLARLAGETGFADQSHLCRVLRAELAQTPSALRELLSRPPTPAVE